jgi:small subunit ribosomal protein S9
MPTKKEDTAKDDKTMTFNGHYYYANGKRKTAVARVRLYEKGQGRIVINGKPYDKYLSVPETRAVVKVPLKLTDNLKNFDISVVVVGGGAHSQADAIRHGIAKALIVFDAELRPVLKKAGLLTRDDRSKERKKYGLKKARRAPQFSKR